MEEDKKLRASEAELDGGGSCGLFFIKLSFAFWMFKMSETQFY